MLTEGLTEKPWHEGEDDEEQVNPIARRWSLWKQTDPVSLHEGKVRTGLPEFAACYHH